MSAKKSDRKRVAAGATASALAALLATGGMLGAAPAAVAAGSTIDPFAASAGFTVVALGDATLGNGELEGSVAALGAVSSTTGNYPIQHDIASAGQYSVPVIDGVPVRVLAGSFAGAGNLQLANVSNTGNAGAADKSASIKLGDVSNVALSSRSGGVGPAAGGEFARLTNTDNGWVDLLAVPYAPDALDDVKTSSPVASYLDLAQVDAAADALEAGYGTSAFFEVPVADEGGLVYPLDFADDRPNVVDYADVAGKTIKLDRWGGYTPTADAPLIVRVAPGTTTIGRINFEGWSAQLGAQQSYAQHIMIDLSAITTPVTVGGLELGSVFAPYSDVTFDSGVSHNGQWLTKSFTSRGGAELHHYTFGGRIPTEPNVPNEPNEPNVPNEPNEPNEPNIPNEPNEPNIPNEPTQPTVISNTSPEPAPAATSAEGLAVTGQDPLLIGGLIAAAGFAAIGGSILLLIARRKARA